MENTEYKKQINLNKKQNTLHMFYKTVSFENKTKITVGIRSFFEV